ncbi:MAG: serine hydrolase domain-containing protein [Spirochaetales bacterium]|jgi:CubicO group peptidase (beta-lactamase class C family)
MNKEKLAESIEKIAQRAIIQRYTAGMVIRAEIGGEALFEGAYGYACDTATRRDLMTASTKFDIASLTKLFTTTSALRLATLCDVKLDMKLSDIESMSRLASGFPLSEKAFASITARMLMTHSSGLHYWYPFYAARNAQLRPAARVSNGNPAPGEQFASILEEMLERFPLGSGTVYSDINYMLLGKIVEGACGLPLQIALGELVSRPLGLADTGYRPGRGPFAATEFGNGIEEKMVADLGLSYSGWRPVGLALEGEADDGNCHYFFNDVAGHAGVFSTVRDACALGRLYLAPEAYAGFIAPELALEARNDHGGGRGLGFQLGELYPRGGFGHTGFTGTYLYLHNASGLALAIFANRLHVEEPRNINELRREIANTVIDALGIS